MNPLHTNLKTQSEHMKKRLALVGLLLLAACSSEPRLDPLHLDYSRLGKIYIDAQDLRIIDRSKSVPQWKPYVGHLFQPKLTDAINRMAADRLQAAGQMGHATLIIKDATVTEQPLSTDSDFGSYFKRQQSSKYIGRMELSLEAQSPSDGSIAMANAHATYAITLPEDPTEYERNEAYRKLLNELMAEINKNLEQSIRAHMSRFILTGPSLSNAPAPMEAATPRGDSLMPQIVNE